MNRRGFIIGTGAISPRRPRSESRRLSGLLCTEQRTDHVSNASGQITCQRQHASSQAITLIYFVGLVAADVIAPPLDASRLTQPTPNPGTLAGVNEDPAIPPLAHAGAFA